NGNPTDLIHLSADGKSFIIDEGYTADSFRYIIQVGGKGTFSEATVTYKHAAPTLGADLLTNGGFEHDQATDGGYVVVSNPSGWTNENASVAAEIVRAPYGGVTGFADDQFQWLDTAASPGNVHLSQGVQLATGATAQL